MNLALVSDWKLILSKAWSIKFNIAATLFAAAEVAVQFVEPDGLPNGLFAGIAACISIAANVARLMAQKEIGNGPDK